MLLIQSRYSVGFPGVPDFLPQQICKGILGANGPYEKSNDSFGFCIAGSWFLAFLCIYTYERTDQVKDI
jgi:hypothetical protein